MDNVKRRWEDTDEKKKGDRKGDMVYLTFTLG